MRSDLITPRAARTLSNMGLILPPYAAKRIKTIVAIATRIERSEIRGTWPMAGPLPGFSGTYPFGLALPLPDFYSQSRFYVHSCSNRSKLALQWCVLALSE